MQIRTPAVAGMFYPDKRDGLVESIHECMNHRLGPGRDCPPNTGKIFGAICPHAGYMYSGPVACHSYHAIAPAAPKLFVIIGPNHSGTGRDVATMKDCKWQTPLGDVIVDSEVACKIAGHAGIDTDYLSHVKEHSIEVQLPMIQEITENSEIVPITMKIQDKDSAEIVGRAVAESITGKDAMVIGSSDFTHYEPGEVALKQDMQLIEPILRLDVDGFYKILKEKRVSACGYGAMAATMIACRELGASRGELLKYSTSGDVTGDMSSVVGYGAITFT